LTARAFQLPLAVLSLAAMIAGCAAKKPPAPPPPYVETTVATYGAVRPSSQMSGLIAPYQNVAIQSTLSEPADSVDVQEGDRVGQGETLAQLDTADLQAELQSDLATAQSDAANTSHTVYSGNESIVQGNQTVQSAQANLARDTRIAQRDESLLHQGYVSQQQYDQDEATVRDDQATLKSAIAAAQANGTSLAQPGLQQSSVAQAKAQEQVALAQAQQVRVSIQKATIASPINGVVVNRNLNPGEYPGSREIFTLQQVQPIYAVLRGSATQIAGIVPGAKATITTDDAHGTFTEIGRVAGVLNQIQPGSTQFQVKVMLANADNRLRPGMAVNGNVELPAQRGVRVPTTAFTDDDHDAVMLVQNGAVRIVKVTEVASNGTQSIVSDVPAGSRVIDNGQESVADGEKVSYKE
jgi:multidrug efflux pump subunit AcrA (membrane-fusion protein)